ncbi:dihydrofolate reductase-like domain-containing protein [Lipomyces oligophaga]|uniref:dihydrofolate reductase-like domain-containing protein n=1 Tax=Lipomyces oligophaga TaxID=45792 RepID=UPI0034CD3995
MVELLPALSELDEAHFEPYLASSEDRHYASRASRKPHVTLTYAQSLDSRIAAKPGTRTVLSGSESKTMTHYLRSRHDAILVGVNTFIADNPTLNCRYPVKGKSVCEASPQPIILDPSFRAGLSQNSAVMLAAQEGAGKAPWVLVSRSCYERMEAGGSAETELAKAEREKLAGVQLIPIAAFTGQRGDAWKRVAWKEILCALADRGIQSLMVEGGSQVICDLLDLIADNGSETERLGNATVDSLIVTIAPVYLGREGIEASPRQRLSSQYFDELRWRTFGADSVVCSRIR